MLTIKIPEPLPFQSVTPGPQRLSNPIPFLEFVGRVLGNVTGTLEIAQAISHAKRAIKDAQDSGAKTFEISPADHQVLLVVCKQRQLHMYDFEQLEPFFNALLQARG